ncbi:MAG: isocitrate/isopropylmalate dehydrogenase family protein [Gammaproteobacteria bacterium]
MTTNSSTSKIPATLIMGDGIGPEIVEAAVGVLKALGAGFEWDYQEAGMAAVRLYGDPLPRNTLESIRRNRLALKGPLITPVGGGYRSINVTLRKEFQLFANIRPARSYLPEGLFKDVDVILIRENTEGLYVGVEHYIPIADDPRAVAEASGIITRFGCRRIAEFACEYALKAGRKKITIVHKANILKALTGLFLETCQEVGRRYQDRLTIEERIVDACAMQLVINPAQFDIILTTNMFGDILSDECAGLVGGLGMAPGANVGTEAAVFEAVHGSAPDIAGKGIANPTALMLAAALMLEHVHQHDNAERLRAAIKETLRKDQVRTPDLGGDATTIQFAEAVIRRLS